MKFNFIVTITFPLVVVLAGCNRSYHDERKVQQITCVNNMKQIGLAFRLWAGDHDDQFPFNVSTNAGGTLELCGMDKDGFDTNAYLYLRTMTDELGTPLILVCPQDHSKRATRDFQNLRPENITYRFRMGTNVSEAVPHEILAVCPIDGNILHADGTVTSADGKSVEDSHSMQIR